jgi:hypothetical protein
MAALNALTPPAINAEPTDFARYQVILDRAPFGPVAAGAEVAQPNFASRYLFVALVNSNGEEGVLQAIIHNKETNHSSFRAEGEVLDNDVKVVRIESKPPKVVLQAGLEVGTLTFQERTPGAAAPMMAGGTPGAAPPPPPSPTGIRRIPFRRGN